MLCLCTAVHSLQGGILNCPGSFFRNDFSPARNFDNESAYRLAVQLNMVWGRSFLYLACSLSAEQIFTTGGKLSKKKESACRLTTRISLAFNFKHVFACLSIYLYTFPWDRCGASWWARWASRRESSASRQSRERQWRRTGRRISCPEAGFQRLVSVGTPSLTLNRLLIVYFAKEIV